MFTMGIFSQQNNSFATFSGFTQFLSFVRMSLAIDCESVVLAEKPKSVVSLYACTEWMMW